MRTCALRQTLVPKGSNALIVRNSTPQLEYALLVRTCDEPTLVT